MNLSSTTRSSTWAPPRTPGVSGCPACDPLQTPWERYLDEVQQAGYHVQRARALRLPAHGPRDRPRGVREARPDAHRRHCLRRPPQGQGRPREGQGRLRHGDGGDRAQRREAPRDPARGLHGHGRQPDRRPTLTEDEWASLNIGMTSSASTSTDKHGAVLVFHTHADSHVGDAGGDRALPRRHRPRDRPALPRYRATSPTAARTTSSSSRTTPTGSSTSTSSRSTARSAPGSARAAGLRPGRPPRRHGGAAAGRARHAVASRRAGRAGSRPLLIVEQDMYPCDFNKPLPIASPHAAVLQGLWPDRRPAARLTRAPARPGAPPPRTGRI